MRDEQEKLTTGYKVTNVKFSSRVHPPILEHMFSDIGLHYWGGNDRYILRHSNFVFTFMSSGSFLNVTGCLYMDQVNKAFLTLQSIFPHHNLTFGPIKCDTISAVSKLRKNTFANILKSNSPSPQFKIKLYRNIPSRINVRLEKPLPTSPKMCANLFATGSICIFGARKMRDIDTFLSHFSNM